MSELSQQLGEEKEQEIYRKPWWKRGVRVYVSLVVLGAVFWFGYAVGALKGMPKVVVSKEGVAVQEQDFEYGDVSGKSQRPPEFLSKDVDFNLFWKAWEVIQNNYVDRPAGETRLLYGSIAGLVASLGDPFSVFLEPQITKQLNEDLSGRIEGIGAEIGMRDSHVTVISPLPESPAERAGLKPGDTIWAIDGEPTEGMDIDVAVSHIRGEKGTRVTLSVSHNGDQERNDISITRDTIRIVSVLWKLLEQEDYAIPQGKKVGYIKLTHFNADTNERMQQAVQQAILERPFGLVLDLRNNPGGYLDQAISIASFWVAPGGIVVQEKNSSGDISSHLATGRAELAALPTIVLINKGSASGSEIVAGALQDNGLATLVGQTSFGKGSVQSIENLPDGSSIKITVARWLTPRGRQIDQQGIEPDVMVEVPEEETATSTDRELQKAVEVLFGK